MSHRGTPDCGSPGSAKPASGKSCVAKRRLRVQCAFMKDGRLKAPLADEQGNHVGLTVMPGDQGVSSAAAVFVLIAAAAEVPWPPGITVKPTWLLLLIRQGRLQTILDGCALHTKPAFCNAALPTCRLEG